MTQNEQEERRSAVEYALRAIYEVTDDVHRYIDESFVSDENLPNFHRLAEQLVPDAHQQAEQSLSRSSLAQIAEIIQACVKCPLGKLRQHAVPGEGAINARLLVVGEGPGQEEDVVGKPFVGRAGKYFNTWLDAIGLSREFNVYITNIVKCRPPENRNPSVEEALSCLPYLKRQIALVKPDVILCLGKVAAHFLLERNDALREMRNTVHRFGDIPVIVTYHPAAVLRNSDLRSPVWEDLKQLANVLDLPLNQRGR